jgi:hypothetical protein
VGQGRGREFIHAWAAAPPGCNFKGARQSWDRIADEVRKRSKSRRIDDCISNLRIKGATGIEQYEQRLKENAGNQEVLNDLLFEGRAALMFLRYEWRVVLRESPDLELSLNGELLYAEVKHFREKKQDVLDEQAMLDATDELVPIGDLRETEKSQPWEQISEVAVKKAKDDQYIEGAPNILVVESGSGSLDLTADSAVHAYDDEASKSGDLRLRRLNGIMLINTRSTAFRPSPWNVQFCTTSHAAVPLSGTLVQALDSFRLDEQT